MKSNRWVRLARSWFGVFAATIALICSVWLTAAYIHGRWTTPRDKARIDALKEKARTDLEIQKVLQPEFDRQHEMLARRRSTYSRGGITLLLAIGAFLAWFKWLRPPNGQWENFPAAMQKLFEKDARIHAAGLKDIKAEFPGQGQAFPAIPMPKHQSQPESVDTGYVAEILEKTGRSPEAIIPVLQAIQQKYRYLPEAALQRVCRESEITPAQIAGVASFYGQFRMSPVGEHIVKVCEGTACHVSGAVEVGNELRRCLGIPGGCDTDPAGQFTMERVACIGSCSLAPVITIDEKIYGHLSALSAGRVVRDFIESQAAAAGNGHGTGRAKPKSRIAAAPKKADQKVEIRIGLGSCGIASGALEVQSALLQTVESMGVDTVIKAVGCSGLCHREPLVEVVENGTSTLYGNVLPEDVRKILRRHAQPEGAAGRLRERLLDAGELLTKDSAWNPLDSRRVDASPYLGKQVRIVLENCGGIDPLSLDDYRKRQGMTALEKCLRDYSPEDIIEKVRLAGLRGRGGAGFPTALKWKITRQAKGSPKYVICNGDEGDPGAFMDRAVLEADPFRVVEGLAIAGYAIGAAEGYVYVRLEYPIAVRHVRAAIEKAGNEGFLGENILGSGFSFKLHVREGAGAFVCGEETALIQSIEGKRGMPRPRPPYPAESGLWGRPTLINNVETLACLPWILRQGPEAFAAMGTEKSKGTKVFSLAGKIQRGGLIEVPMGITIREIVEEIGGGIKGGRKFKAVLAGGPSGGCIPASLADTRIDYEELASTGAIMGSGGFVVLDDHDCAVEIARYFLKFTQNESCGKCTFCRVGTKRMLEILERICAGKGKESDLRTLEELSFHVKKGSLCGLGQTAPNPVITTLKYFRHEYEAHIRDHSCPAGACKALIHYRILDNCTGCTLCAQACPSGAIAARPYVLHEVMDDLCTRCGMCVTACPENAVEVA